MIALTADDSTLLKDVRLFLEPIEVYDSSGRLLGLFVPANLERAKERQKKALAMIDRAEIERRKQSEEPRGTLQDALRRLDQLEAEMERRKAAGEKEFTTEEALAYFQSLRQQDATPKPVRSRTETDQCTRLYRE